ncbi:MAG TPA: ATP-binding protein [Vicinamibacterales bacterium]|nr:ATP-binding protein [Vicinamibacterales bacterium]
MAEPIESPLNPFERIRSTEGKVSLLMGGLAALCIAFDLFEPIDPPWTWWLFEFAAVTTYIALGTLGTMRIVARPVRRAKSHIEAIGAGDYTRPVLTRRTDEFGDLLRGVEQTRQNLVAAIRARDAAEQKYRAIVERSVQGFYQSNEAGELLAANDSLARMLGYESLQQLLAEPAGIAKRLHVDQVRRSAFVRQMNLHGFVTGFEVALRRLDGRVIWVTQSARVVRDHLGRTYWEGFLDDITERKEAEQLKSDFVSFVTHQLRTPLSGIRWMLELAQGSNRDPETASYVDDAHASAQRLIGLVNDLLDVARLEAGRLTTEPQPFDLHRMAVEVVAELTTLAAARGQETTVDGAGDAVALADPQLARQAVLNLISNAIKYTPDGGRVSITTARETTHVRLSIRDTGIGISETAQRRLFEKFFRADNAQVVDTEGTGLGLYLVRLIAERSGGAVTCTSVEGAGSTFTLTLPVADKGRAAP